jgi:centrosomal protein CEP104
LSVSLSRCASLFVRGLSLSLSLSLAISLSLSRCLSVCLCICLSVSHSPSSCRFSPLSRSVCLSPFPFVRRPSFLSL